MTAVKICGLTRSEDVAAASELGAAILGFIFAASSPRRIAPERAREISAAALPGALRAGVFVTESREEVARAVREASLQIVQLHRAIDDADFQTLWGPVDVISAVRVESGRAGLPAPARLKRCRAILWDSSVGHGRVSDWSEIERAGRLPMPVPVFIAGGLEPDNVGDVIRRLRPAGVDVASGVESSPGIKDRKKLERFFEAVREADRDNERG
jgi:phosphoribosylanthranilate isomerase